MEHEHFSIVPFYFIYIFFKLICALLVEDLLSQIFVKNLFSKLDFEMKDLF